MSQQIVLVPQKLQYVCCQCQATHSRLTIRRHNGTSYEHWYNATDGSGGKLCDRCYKKKSRSATMAGRRVKIQTFQHYFGPDFCCQGHKYIEDCDCKINNPTVLQLHHPEGGGDKHRMQIFGNPNVCGVRFYAWLRRNGYPDYGFILLCANCHLIIEAQNREAKWIIDG
jgi:hypothetical protein